MKAHHDISTEMNLHRDPRQLIVLPINVTPGHSRTAIGQSKGSLVWHSKLLPPGPLTPSAYFPLASQACGILYFYSTVDQRGTGTISKCQIRSADPASIVYEA